MSELPQDYCWVALTASNRDEVVDLERWAFPTKMTHEQRLSKPDTLDYERTPGVRCRASGRLVAMHTSVAWGELSVPGGTAKAAGLSWVSVHPEHRRQGLLGAMMRLHFSRCIERNEAFSMLTASEPEIYGRFGYGCAATELELTLNRKAALVPVQGADEVQVRIVDLDRARHMKLIERLHRFAGAKGSYARPGWGTRDTQAYQERMLFEFDWAQSSAEPLRLMLAERNGEPVGFALFSRGDIWKSWGEGMEGTNVNVREYAALDGAAAYALWSRLLDLDLTASVYVEQPLALDDPLLGMLVSVRAARPRVSDLLWLRLIDVRQALSCRRYAANLDVVLELTDRYLPHNQGRWRLKAEAFSQHVQVSPTDAPADLRLDVKELSAAYLGGVSLAALFSSGLVEVLSPEPELLLKTASAFLWPLAPACSWHF
jgi:predicted acetyltransferase